MTDAGDMERHPGPAMLIAFRAQNVRSFRGRVELLAARNAPGRAGHPAGNPLRRQDGKPISVLPAAGVFGANASGKSNLLRAMADMRMFVLQSFRKGKPGSRLSTSPFLLGEDDGSAPSTYEVELICRCVCQVGVFDRVRWAGVWGGRESGAPGSVSALPV